MDNHIPKDSTAKAQRDERLSAKSIKKAKKAEAFLAKHRRCSLPEEAKRKEFNRSRDDKKRGWIEGSSLYKKGERMLSR